MSESVERFEGVLRFAAGRGLSAVHLKAGNRPLYERGDQLIMRREEAPFEDRDLGEVEKTLLTAEQVRRLETGHFTAVAHGVVGAGRFRIGFYRQRGRPVAAVRVVPARVATVRDLGLPPALGDLMAAPSGLILLCGGSGSGLTSTLAALLDVLNISGDRTRTILVIEDPIEILLEDKLAWIAQQQVGTDVCSAAAGLRAGLASNAHVIALSRLGSAEEAELLLTVAEADRLVIAVLAARDVLAGLRAFDLFADAGRWPLWRRRLAHCLLAVVSQRLLPAADGKRRLPACELLRSDGRVFEALRGGHDPAVLQAVMDEGPAAGMLCLEHSLAELVRSGALTPEVARAAAARPAVLQHILGTRGAGPASY